MTAKTVMMGLQRVAAFCLLVTVASSALGQEPLGSTSSLAPLHSRAMESVRAEEIETIVAKLFPDTMFSAEPTTNTLYFRCDDRTRKDVESFLADAETRAQRQMLENEAIFETQRQTAAAALKETTVVVELAHISPSEALNVISELGINARATATGNSLIFKTADVDQTKELIALFQRIDVPMSEEKSSSPRVTEAIGNAFGATSMEQLRTVEEIAEAFKAKQAMLRMQIELQREKLRMLEQRLEKREKIAQEYFSKLETQAPELSANAKLGLRGDVKLKFIPEKEMIVARGNEASIRRAGELLGLKREGDGFAQQTDSQQTEEPVASDAESAGVSGRPTGKDVELANPVESEQEAADLIREYGGWYKLNKDSRIEEINMVYFEDESGTRYDNPIRDESFLSCVPDLPDLERLYLQGKQVSDQGMICVGQCKKLTDFFVWDATELSDEGVEHLAGLRNLKKIHIGNAGLTDRSLEVISELPGIETLMLQENDFSDKGLVHLSRVKTLKEVWLGLGESRFSDVGVRYLLQLKKLRKLGVQRTPISRKTIQDFESEGVELVNPVEA